MLQAKYLRLRACSLREEYFVTSYYISLKNMTSEGGTSFDPRGLIWTVFLDSATSKLLSSRACGFRVDFFPILKQKDILRETILDVREIV